MSYKTAAWAWEQTQLTASERLTLLALANHSDANNCCWPRIATLAADAGLSRATVSRMLTRLELLGLITHEPRHRNDGSQTSSLYVLLLTVTHPPSHGDTPPISQRDTPHLTVRHHEPGKENPVSEPGQINTPPSPPRGGEARAPVFDPNIQKILVAKYALLMGGEEAVIEAISDALAHKAADKWKDRGRYVENWIKRDVKRLEEAHGRFDQHGGRSQGGQREAPDLSAFDAFG